MRAWLSVESGGGIFVVHDGSVSVESDGGIFVVYDGSGSIE
jgi:hypothetical protein